MSSGFTGVFSLGQIGFMAIGAYVGALINLPPIWKDPILLPGLPVAGHVRHERLARTGSPRLRLRRRRGASRCVVAVVVGYPLMRLSGNYVAVATMGFLIIVYTIADPLGQRHARLAGPEPDSDLYQCLVGVYLGSDRRSMWPGESAGPDLAASMIASRENLIAARAVGVNVHRARLLAFTVCGFLTGSEEPAWSPDRHGRAQRLLLHDDIQRHHHGCAGWDGQRLRGGASGRSS